MFRIMKQIVAFSGEKKPVLTKAIIVSFIGAVFGALQFLALLLTLEMIIGGKTANALEVLLVMAFSVAGRIACFYYSTNAETETGYFMVAQKRVAIGDRLRYIPMGYFNKNSLGSITGLVTTTLSDVENTAARCLVIVVGGFLNTFVLSLAMLAIDVRIGLLALLGIVVYLGATELSTHATIKTGPKRQQAQQSLVKAVLEYVQGMSVVKSYGLEKDNNQTVTKAVDSSCEKAVALTVSVTPWIAVRQLAAHGFGAVIAVCALYFYGSGQLSLVKCILVLIASFMLYEQLENAGNMSDNLQMLGESMRMTDSINDTPVMDIDGKEITPKETSVDFKNVTFAYENRNILNNVSVHIPAGKTTAIVGPSGGGKTTMCSLIARFFDVQSGQILLGGHDVKEYKLDSLMKNISMVFQDVYLFQDTIENNIGFGKPDATHEQVVAAAKSACCHDFIEALPDGYETILGEGGATLSGGEKQRISIARAMLKDAPLIILDEATASVDPENEEQLQQAINALTQDKTIIMIAHRLKTVRNADQILVLNGGKITQQGTHEELASQQGLYADFLHARQDAADWKLA